MNNDHNTALNIRIDHLIIDGIALTRYQQQQVRDSLQAELAELIFTHGIPQAIENLSSKISGPPIQLQMHQPEPVQLGRQIAASLYNSLADGKRAEARCIS